MSMTNLATLTQLAQAATPGPWTTAPTSIPNESLLQIGTQVSFGSRSIQLSIQDAAFIAACSPDVILALVARVRALEIVADTARELVAPYHTAMGGGSPATQKVVTALSTLTPS